MFVDAAIPECEGEARLNPVVADLLWPLAVEGVLPPGFLWLGEGGLERLIPDSELRARVEAERARSLGWSVLEDVGNHLDVVNRAAEVAADLVRIGA